MIELMMFYDLETEKELGLQLIDVADSRWDEEIKPLLEERGIGFNYYYGE